MISNLYTAYGAARSRPLAVISSPLQMAFLLMLTVTTLMVSKPVAAHSWIQADDDACPDAGESLAMQITDEEFQLAGPNALGRAGDYLLLNDRAAFVIQGIGQQNTYYHYDGILIDAVAVENCEQRGEELFDELGLMVAKLDITDTDNSLIRAFRGDRVEVLNDGSNGEASVIRVHGEDDIYWIVELELIRRAYSAGKLKEMSDPFGLDIVVDYILAPNSSTLSIEYNLINKKDESNIISMAFPLMSSGNAPSLQRFSIFEADLLGLPLEVGVPWITSTQGNGAYAFGIDTYALTGTNISGIDAVLDPFQLASFNLGSWLRPAGQAKDRMQQRFYVTVGSQGEWSAVEPYLEEYNPTNVITREMEFSVEAKEEGTGLPVEGAKIELQRQSYKLLGKGDWETFLTVYTDEEGKFEDTVQLMKYFLGVRYRVMASAEGRNTSEPIEFSSRPKLEVNFEHSPKGQVRYTLRDQANQSLPAKISFFQDGGVFKRIYPLTGDGVIELPPGEYQVSVTRGYEYNTYQGELTVTPGGEVALTATLSHMVDTSGYLSFDPHVHSSPSADSTVPLTDRVATSAAAGLEILIATDHEMVTDMRPAIEETGLGAWVNSVIGQEVTATLPEHTIAYPLDADFSQGPKGEPVVWQGLDIGEIYAAEKARGADVRTIAHPAGYMEIIEWNRMTGAPDLEDMTALGFKPSAKPWSWDFEAVELITGIKDIFDESGSGLFDDWMSFLNHGHHITAVGASDVHGYEEPGTPRSYFRSSTDAAVEFVEDELVAAVTKGDVVVSTGAFARVEVNGTAGMGELITDQDGSIQLSVNIQAIPEIDVTHFKIFANCQELQTIDAANPVDSAIKFADTVNVSIPLEDAHIVLAAFGQKSLPRGLEQFEAGNIPRVITNPVYVDVDGNGQFDAPGGRACDYEIQNQLGASLWATGESIAPGEVNASSLSGISFNPLLRAHSPSSAGM